MIDSDSMDTTFLSKLTEVVRKNLNNEQFGVSTLVKEIGMSRSFIHRQLKKLTSQSVSQFIRNVRLDKAMEMLRETGNSASEVAFKTGFSSPAYFNHCFHERFGFPPGEARKRANYIIEQETTTGNTETGSEQHSLSGASQQNLKSRKKKMIIYISAMVIFLALISVLVFNQNSEWLRGKMADTEKSIIVLPFKNLSDDPVNEYFADGIREDILNNLYWITSLRVISNTTSENFRENKLTAHEIARQMNVNYVLEGSVRRYDDKVRINIQLIDPKRDDHLWSDSFDRDMNDIIAVQNEIAFKVADKLKTVIPDNEIRQIEKISTQNPKAYDYYLQARFLLHRANSPQRSGFDAAGVIHSVEYYKKAIEEDPGFAEAYAGLANATMNLTAWGITRDTGMVDKVYQLCQKAIGLDPECAEAYALKGATFGFRHDFKKSGEEYRKAIELNPNFATARQWYAQNLMITGPISEARKQVNKAMELEPFFWVVKNLDSWIAYFEKDYKRSLEVCQVAHDLNPVYSDNMWLFFLNYVKLNEGEKARDQIKTIAMQYSKSDDYSAEIDEAFAGNGIEGLLTCMIEINKNRPVRVEGLNGNPFYISWWNTILGNKQEALYWLEQTITHKFPPYHYLNLIINHPDFQILHDDPRFTAIAKRIGLEAYLT